MSVKKMTYAVNDCKYTTTSYRYRRVRRVRHPDTGHSGYVNRERGAAIHSTFSGDFEVEIDIPSIVNMMVARAQQNSSGRAKMLKGLVKVKSERKLLDTRIEELPIRAGYEEVK